MFDILTLAFWGAVAYLIHVALLAGRKLWSAVTGQPIQPVFVSVSPEARKSLRIAGRIALGVTLALAALSFLAMLALAGADF